MNKFLNAGDIALLPNDLIIYGSGESGEYLNRWINKHRPDCIIHYYADSFKRGEKNGIPVLPLSELYESNLIAGKKIIIASIFWPEIEIELKQKKGIEDYLVMSSPFIHDLCSLSRYGSFTFTDKELAEYSENFSAAESLLSTPREREAYRLLIDLRSGDAERMNRAMEEIPAYQSKGKQYLEHLNKTKIKNIVEGGVYDGSNSSDFVEFFGKDIKIFGFDPFLPKTGNKIVENLIKGKVLSVYPQALWDSNCKMEILNDDEQGSDSSVVAGSQVKQSEVNNFIECISLDSFAFENKIKKIDFIKLDIEGAELEALSGAREIIVRDRPHIAVSIYHKKEDLFQLPLFLNNLNAGYKYHLVLYSSTFIDTVLYAVPQ